MTFIIPAIEHDFLFALQQDFNIIFFITNTGIKFSGHYILEDLNYFHLKMMSCF